MESKDFPKVLVGVVTYDGKDYIFPQNYAIVSNLSYPNYDFVIVDNSKGNSYITTLRRRRCRNVHHVNRASNSRMTLAMCQNYIRELMLKGNYDYLMLIESDLTPPKDIIEKLMRHNKPVTGAAYFIGTEGISIPCIFFVEKKPSGLTGTRLISTKTQPDGTTAYTGKEEYEKFLNTGLQQVHGCGFGSVLMRRTVVEKNVFWYDERFDSKHSDVYYYMMLARQAIPVFVDTDIIVPHYPSSWKDVADK